MKIIIIGGVAAGMSAASKIKRISKETEVVVYEKGSFLSYGACGLPYYVSGLNDDYKKMIARTEEQFVNAGIEIHMNCEVVKVIPEAKNVFVRDLNTGKMFTDHYDKLMIATGAEAIVPNMPGTNFKGVHILKSLEDGFRMKETVNSKHVRNVVVIGGGYIGIEVAETLNEMGKDVTVIEFADRILKPFDDEIEKIIREHLLSKNIHLNLSEKMEELLGNDQGEVTGVRTDRSYYEADMVVLALGIRPCTKFMQGTGAAMLKNGALIIDREMRTNIPDIYSAGDCATVYHLVEEDNTYIALGTTANKCGRIAGENMLGNHIKFAGTLGSAAIKAGELEAARTGLSESTVKELNIDYTTAFVQTLDHAPYYPAPTPIWIKIICEKRTRKILGAQAVGYKGAVLRIDAFAAAITGKMTASELGMTDFCYAPPFAGVWDAINVASNAVK
mgnify:CR=1 FL=1